MTIAIRRARTGDVDFLVELVTDEDVEPFLGAVSAKDTDAVAEEVARSEREPHDYGRFVIEVDGERAGGLGFELANRRSRIAHLERLAVHPSFRGRRVADDAARRFQQHLVHDLGYHRLQLEIYGFNARAIAHAERVGYVREGVRRRAYRRHGDWVDGVLFSLLAEEASVAQEVLLLHDYVGAHNECVRTGDWEPLAEWFADDARLVFEGVPVGPFDGRDAIAAAYRAQPPDDQVLVFAVEEGDPLTARYGWLRDPAAVAGVMRVTSRDGRIASLVVTFDS